MTFNGSIRKLSGRLGALAGLLLSLTLAIAGPTPAAQDEVKVLREHVKAFWDARVKGDWATVYDYLGETEKKQWTRETYLKSNQETGPFRYLSYQLGGVEVTEDMGWAHVEFTTEAVLFPGLKPKTVSRWEQWEEVDGKWFVVTGKETQNLPSLPPSLRPVQEEKAVMARANAFWKAREKSDYAAVYQFLPPAVRKKVSQKEFLEKKAMHLYLDHRVLWAEARENEAVVRTIVESRPHDPNLSKAESEYRASMQLWVKVDGQWYLDIKE